MKKIMTSLLVLLMGVCLVACHTQQKTEKKLETYQAITLAKVEKKIQQEDSFFLYVGRPTCPHCRAFAPQLEKAIQHTQVTVYYLDTDEEEPERIQTFAQDAAIQTVPHLTYYENGEKMRYLEKGSESSLAEIEDFLKHTN
ncbi:thioredoxin family protein [Streptococcus ovis]|uniref:thioredoxin family protein n=1 Tax=Streptococcus ovis TaxID=82806 RepID=UPI00037A629F|nr:thioredoxin family protein [Streptococcus ovis]